MNRLSSTPYDDLLISQPEKPSLMTESDRFEHFAHEFLPRRLADELTALQPDFDVEYRDTLKALLKHRRLFGFFHGNVGTGKTFSAIIAFLLIRKNTRSYMLRSLKILNPTAFFTRLQKEMNTDIYHELLHEMKTTPYLLIDDFGTNKLTEWNNALITDIIDARYQNYISTVITSNYSLSQLNCQGYSRVVSRIGDMCQDRIYEFKKNLRNSKSMKSRDISNG